MKKPHICVVGASNIDLISYAPRLPKLGETLPGTKFQMGFGGKGANQAVAAARLGAKVSLIGRVGSDAFGEQLLANAQKEQDIFIAEKQRLKQRLPIIWNEVLNILKGVIPYVLVGIAIGGLMHGYIPEGFFEKYMAKDNLFAVPIATILGLPMYFNASGILPVDQVLVGKGIPIGTAIAFMMGVVGLSLPEAMLLKKVMTFKLIAIFFSVVTLCIIISGYLFNIIL